MTISPKIKDYFGCSVAKCLIYEVDAEDPTAQQKLVGYFVSDTDEHSKYFISESSLEGLIKDFETDIRSLEEENDRLLSLINDKIDNSVDMLENILYDINDNLEKDPAYRVDVYDILRAFRKEMK